jgi:hypothetical protein
MEGVQEVREKTLVEFYEKTDPHFLWLEEIVGEVQGKLNEYVFLVVYIAPNRPSK